MRVGGVITFNCGANLVTVPITTEHQFRTDINTVLDGGNRITLQGNGFTRIFGARKGYQSSLNSITLQNITLANGRSSGTAIRPVPAGAPNTCSQGTELEGGGGAIFVRDMVLHIINSKFVNNHGPSVGPDVAGGAIYAEGSLDVTIVKSTFQTNDASNGGAFGSLQSKVTLIDNLFQGNQAVGHGGNYNIASSGCPLHLNQYQVGSGGSAGAVYFDGQASPGISVCGNKFRNNSGTDAMGGALWAAGDPGTINITISQSEVQKGNKNGKGGAVFGFRANMVVTRSTFANNSAGYGGAVQTDNSTFTSVNNTYSANSATTSVGTLALFTTTGIVLNSTFSGNKAPCLPDSVYGQRLNTNAEHFLRKQHFQRERIYIVFGPMPDYAPGRK